MASASKVPQGTSKYSRSSSHRRKSMAPIDIVLVAVKAYTLDSALQDTDGAVGPDTVILPLLNGIRHMDVIAKNTVKTVYWEAYVK